MSTTKKSAKIEVTVPANVKAKLKAQTKKKGSMSSRLAAAAKELAK